ncbi:serine protease [Acaryochloris sp. IP29b_bin.148]|uniref:S1 family peptidase n=1 Tax=Acaryochloris sp. IP29b_bin.148 TaxID=2969218 RepID=UPI00260599DD|nr:serine protease [Acaryochloris sp. IP29b_bin.148]
MDSDLSAQQIAWLRRQAQVITVTVWVDDRWSSGILIHRQGQTYTVITNQHVVDSGQRLQVVMFDGKRYQARHQRHSGFKSDDLALLKFQSSEVSYSVAKMGSALTLMTGAPVFASGFPAKYEVSSKPKFRFTTGQVSLVSSKVLKGGYQLGYTNPVEKGMSGGPVLNRWGQVVAINGVHAYPLWGNPYIFMDGSKPDPALFKVMKQSSWAIPVDRFLRLAPAALKVRG